MGKTKSNNSFIRYNEARNHSSKQYLEYMQEVMEELVEEGLSTYGISLYLIQNGYTTIRGKQFTALLVWKLLEKLGLKTVWSAPPIGYNNPDREPEPDNGNHLD